MVLYPQAFATRSDILFHTMHVLFLNPPFHPRFSREQRSPAVTKSGTLYYPKWLAHAAGVAIKSGHDVDLVDAPAAGYSVQAVIDRIAAKNIEAVVCDTSTPSLRLPRVEPCITPSGWLMQPELRSKAVTTWTWWMPPLPVTQCRQRGHPPSP